MTFYKRAYTLILGFLSLATSSIAQDKPIGYWESHLPYDNAIGVATDGTKLFTICNQAFFTYDPAKNQMDAYSKVEGMSDIGMQCVSYDPATSTAILVYANGNIDLFKNNTFYNIPDLKLKTVAGNKQVYQIYTENGTTFLSTSLGIILVDLANQNIIETYQFIRNSQVIPVTGFIGAGNYFYAITPNGLYKAAKNNPDLQNFQVWQNIDSTHVFISIAVQNDSLYLATSSKVYTYTNDSIKAIYSSPNSIAYIGTGLTDLFIGEIFDSYNGKVKLMDPTTYSIIDSFTANGSTAQTVQLADSTIWVADVVAGLEKRTGPAQVTTFYPPGPRDPNSFDIYAYNKNVWIAHGRYSDKYIDENSGSGLSNLDNGKWNLYYQYEYPPFDTMVDFVSVVRDETDGTVYAGSYADGLFILKADGAASVLKQNSIFDTSISAFGAGQRQVLGLALDHNDNLWVTLMYSAHQLYVKTHDSIWYKYQVAPSNSYGGPIAVDNNNQIWYVCAYGSGGGVTGGVVVFNPDTIGANGQQYYHLQNGAGVGNLPSNNVLSIACDKNNNIWIGTDNGIGIVSGCTSPFTQQIPPCDAQIPIVQYDQFAGYLFAGNNVRAIAVDGANRKWVGTDNGVWLLSPDASKIVYRFTAENSPLPSDVIQKITIDKITGDVYIGTDQGLICYHSTAIDGGTTNTNVLTYPNPVPSGYTGTIAIKGLVADADVRITDINGQLVYRTTAFGGQAVWNGMDYKGHRPQSGVYLIFASSSDGSQTYTGKMVFMQ
jgi:hypothetical protein